MERIGFKELPEGLYSAMMKVQTYINNCGLDPILLGLINMRASQINGCAYCLDMHYKEAVHEGDTPQRLISLDAWREAPYYTPAERAVLAFTETLTRMPEADADHLHDELLKYFSKQEIANLSLAIAQINSWNRLMRSFGSVAGKYQVGGIHAGQ